MDSAAGRRGSYSRGSGISGIGRVLYASAAGRTLYRQAESPEPVSYTHLDVYKRQTQHGELLIQGQGLPTYATKALLMWL